MAQVMDLTQSYIVFQLNGAAYGLISSVVQQVDMIESVTPVPNAPEFLAGVVFTRGAMIPAVDLRARFGFPKRESDLGTRLVVVTSGGRTVGLIVDSAREFLPIPDAAIQPPPDTIAGLSSAYLRGIANVNGRLILIMKIEEILSAVDSLAIRPTEAQEG